MVGPVRLVFVGASRHTEAVGCRVLRDGPRQRRWALASSAGPVAQDATPADFETLAAAELHQGFPCATPGVLQRRQSGRA